MDNSPTARMSLDLEVPFSREALSHLHRLSSASALEPQRAGDTGTLTRAGASHAVTVDEAEPLLAFLAAEQASFSPLQCRAAGALRKTAGCVVRARGRTLRRRYCAPSAAQRVMTPCADARRAFRPARRPRGRLAPCGRLIERLSQQKWRPVRRRRRLLNEDKSRSSMDDDDTFAAVGELLEAFRATHTVLPRESPLAPRPAPPEAPPAMSLMEAEQAEQAPADTPAATSAAAGVVASSAADSAAPLAGASNVFGALLDRLSPEGGAKADADGAEGPGTPGESAPASPVRSGGPLVRRWSARLSASMRKAGDELREALEKL